MSRWRGWPAVALLLLLTAAAGLTLTTGAVSIAPTDALAVMGRRLGLGFLDVSGRQADAVVWGIRMPRLSMACVVGGGLGAAGLALQGVLRNEMADPQLLGIGPGAGIGAVIGSVAGGVQGAIVGGVLGGVGTAFVLRRLGRAPTLDRTKLILSGVALGAALSAWVGFLVFSADRSRVPPIEFWLLGSLAGSTWRAVATVAVPVALSVVVLYGTGRALDVMSLGVAEARHLGIDTELIGSIVLVAVGVGVGATVGAVGVVAFIGLLVPHAVRRIAGPDHRSLLLLATIGGAFMLVGSDLVARLALAPIEVPVGLVTSAVGGPVFLWLISKARDE